VYKGLTVSQIYIKRLTLGQYHKHRYDGEHIPKRLSLMTVEQDTIPSMFMGNLDRMLIRKWKGRDGTFTKCDYQKFSATNQR